MPRELALIAISLACLVAQWYSSGGSWKWVTILPILIGIVQLLFAICFCISSYVHQQLHSLDCQNFVHHSSLVFFTYLMNPYRAGFCFWRGPTINFQLFKKAICKGACTLKCAEKRFIPFAICPPQNSRKALHMARGMYCTIHLLEIIQSVRLLFPSILSIPLRLQFLPVLG